MRKLLMTGVVLLLGACGDGGSGGGSSFVTNGICTVVGSGNYVTATAAPPSAFANSTQAFDGDLSSFASLSPAASASGTISGGGIAGSAGEVAGVAIAIPHTGTITVTITTYLNGVVTNSGQAATYHFPSVGGACSGTCAVGDSHAFFGIDTNLDFDQIEAGISITGFDQPLQIAELCVR